jgi:hypothetical protein
MANTKFEIGAQLETLSPSEFNEGLDKHLGLVAQRFLQEYARGFKYQRFGPVNATVSGGTLSLAGSASGQLGPREGFAWSVRRIGIWGLAAGVTPDVVNLYRNSTSRPPIWQLNGNNFAYTWGKFELLLLPGEHLDLAGTGLTTTSQVSIDGDVIEVAAEELAKFL